MSTLLKVNENKKVALPKVKDLKIGVVAAEWNSEITDALLGGVLSVLKSEGYGEEAAVVRRVPGTVELTFGASVMMNDPEIDAVIVIGCVIRGGTPHFDYVCDSVTQGVAMLNAKGEIPVIFCVLTTENEQQAKDRAGGVLGNKGAEAAEAAIKMVDFMDSLN